MSNIIPNKPNGFYLRNEFITWLREDQNYTAGSANSYASYVASANKTILINFFKDDSFFKVIKEVVNQSDKFGVEELIDRLIGIVTKEAPVAVVNKYKNGLIQYRNFLIETLSGEEIIDDVEPLKQFTKAIKESSTVFLKDLQFPNQLTYNKDSLKKIFIFRMVTQDRCYGKVYFLISFLKKLFYKDQISRKFFDDYIENQINNIQLHTNKGTIILNDIKELTIETDSSQKVSVTLILNDNSRSILYTKMGMGNEQLPMNTLALRFIAIDHIFPMKLILEEQEANLPLLKRITQTFRLFKGIKANERIKSKKIKAIGNQLLDTNVFNLNDVPQLKEEMNHINSFIELQLMDGAENLVKKAKFEKLEENKSLII
ncbi:hypothetical protein ADIARSV_0026 [Arcticibacter svalbardensis MN12-7]|uniref:Uncharacterized protein n=1 Tax=Arcticibacter svalbardensis MN12-7 TaxID=1150600 RepID=R9GYN3_9SPHI|nr:hypothetical protein [Arcticibacter svalbardensis]EOR96763.1 hypothetical protein ADIARSV_0026 [Arcticibacter svalbardensis MN12-7]